MAKYIDADEMNKAKSHPLPYTHITPTDTNAESYKRGWNDAIDAIISEAPAADVVEVVRCKDCKHRRVAEYGPMKYECELDTGDPYCHGRQAWWPDWFCAEGVRKDG